MLEEADISLPSFAPFPLNALKGEELDLDSSTTALPGAYVDVQLEFPPPMKDDITPPPLAYP